MLLPTYYYLFINEFYLKYCNAPDNPVPKALSYKKLIYCFIFYNYSGEISLKDSGSSYFYFLANLSEGNLTNIDEVVPDFIPLKSNYFLIYFLSSPRYEIGLS